MAKPRIGNSRSAAKARRARYIDAYMANGQNGRQAAIAAGVPESKASPYAAQMAKNEYVQASIRYRLEELAAPLAMNAAKVVELMIKLALNDRRKFFNENGDLKMVHELDYDTQLALDGFDVENRKEYGERRKVEAEVTTSKVKLTRRSTALDMLAKHFGVYAKDNAQRNDDPDTVAAMVRARLAVIDETTGEKK